MTLLPVEPVRLTIPPQDCWIEFELPKTCQHPECWQLPGPGVHHVVRRSATGGPQTYVSIDGLVVVNVCRLCYQHHDLLTGGIGGHKARIAWPSLEELEQGLYQAGWLWYDRLPAGGWVLVGPLDPPIR